MKLTLITFVALLGAVSAINVDASLVKRQCITNGGLCFTSISPGERNKPCCPGLVCNNKTQPNTNICEPSPSPRAPNPPKNGGNGPRNGAGGKVKKDELSKRSNDPPPPQARDFPQVAYDEGEPIWG